MIPRLARGFYGGCHVLARVCIVCVGLLVRAARCVLRVRSSSHWTTCMCIARTIRLAAGMPPSGGRPAAK
eukprot:scaffold342002_cov22-Prasinocladus_malaysianus.AAC.1